MHTLNKCLNEIMKKKKCKNTHSTICYLHAMLIALCELNIYCFGNLRLFVTVTQTYFYACGVNMISKEEKKTWKFTQLFIAVMITGVT